MYFLILVRQQILEKENSEFRSVKLRLKSCIQLNGFKYCENKMFYLNKVENRFKF